MSNAGSLTWLCEVAVSGRNRIQPPTPFTWLQEIRISTYFHRHNGRPWAMMD
jgi:hypothetical protein